MRWTIAACLAVFMLHVSAEAATRYVTSVACTNTYQVGSNSCGASSGISSYTTIAAAFGASSAGDTLRFPGIVVADGQLTISFVTVRDNAILSAIEVHAE